MALDMQALLADLVVDEGLSLTPYKDTCGFLTIGYGHLIIDPEAPGALDPITEDQATIMLQDDIGFACHQLDHYAPWWRVMADNAQRGLARMQFNLGWGHLELFHKMLAALEAHDYETAAAECLDSEWATQVGARAKRIATLYSSCAEG